MVPPTHPNCKIVWPLIFTVTTASIRYSARQRFLLKNFPILFKRSQSELTPKDSGCEDHHTRAHPPEHHPGVSYQRNTRQIHIQQRNQATELLGQMRLLAKLQSTIFGVSQLPQHSWQASVDQAHLSLLSCTGTFSLQNLSISIQPIPFRTRTDYASHSGRDLESHS